MEAKSGKYVPPHRRNITSKLSFSTHAQARMIQREVSNTSVETAIQSGKTQDNKTSVVYRDKDTHVVMGKQGKVITVSDNKRNTRYDAMRHTEERHVELLGQSQQGNDAAMCELAELYLNGTVVERDVKKAQEWLLKAEKKGNTHAMCLLYKIFQEGLLGRIDGDVALFWLKKAAERNNSYALALLGQIKLSEFLEINNDGYKNAEEQEELKQEITLLLTRSSDRGSTRARWQLGQIHEHGWFGEKNLAEAKKLYIQAASTGSPASLHSLYGLVNQTEFSLQEFEGVLDQACDVIGATSSNLAVEIGLELIRGTLGYYPARGFKLLESAAQKRNIEAVQALRRCYAQGIGCEANSDKAQEWFVKAVDVLSPAAQEGNIKAMKELGSLLLGNKSKDREGNVERAKGLFLKATELGDLEAMYYLSRLYLADDKPTQGASLEYVFNLLKTIIESAVAQRILKIKSLKLFKKYYILNNKWGEEKAEFLMSCLKSWEEIIFGQFLSKAEKNDFAAMGCVLFFYVQKLISVSIKLETVRIIAAKWEKEFWSHTDKSVQMLDLLGEMYQAGELLPQNFAFAAKCFYLGSEDKDGEKAMVSLDRLLSNQKLSTEDKLSVVKEIEVLAESCPLKRPYRIGRILGDIYSEGRLISADFATASFWYHRSASLGNTRAAESLKRLNK